MAQADAMVPWRRALCGVGLAAGLAASLVGCAANVEGAGGLPPTRRVVTTEGPGGTAIVLADGPSANAIILNGSTITRLFETGPVPVALPLAGDTGPTAGNAYRDGFSGTSLYTADLPPGFHVAPHRQESVDYIAVLSGRVDLVLPDGRRTLHAGDVLVQAANAHGWDNPYGETARILVVVMRTASPPR
jgi:hypothetical protein